MIKALIFDLGQVIIPFRIERGLAAWAARSQVPLAEVTARTLASDLPMQFEAGQIEPEDFYRQFSALLGLEVAYEEFCDLYSSIFLPETLLPENLLAGLARRYRLLLLSNTNAIHFPWVLKRYPELGHFHHYVVSYQVRALKPAAQIYRAALERAACRPEECFYTDDIGAYVEAARRMGIDAVEFRGRAALEEELRCRGLRWQED